MSRLWTATFLLLCSVTLVAQQSSNPTVPRFVRFNGTVVNSNGVPTTATLGFRFSLYKDETGGAPLWQEVQNVAVDGAGHYSVLLGANSKDGIPVELFTTNEARWLGVQIEQEAEQARVLLVSVPYALKAGDAETVGGHAVSDFVMSTASNASSSGSGGSDTSTSPTAKSSTTAQSLIAPLAGTVGAGVTNALAKYDGSGNLFGSSLVFDTGAALGIGTQSPAAALDVNSTTAPASGITPFAFRAINALTVGQTNNFPQNNFSSVYSGTGTQSYIYGLVNQIQKTGTGPLTNAFGVLSSVQNNNPTGAITNAYAFVAQQPVTTGPITNSYGFYAEDPNSINYFAGKVGIGTNAPQAALDISNISAPASGVSPNGFRAVGNITVGQTNNFPQNNFSSVYSGIETQGFIYGLVNQIQKTGTGPLTNAYGVLSSVQNNNATGAITNAYAFVAQQPVTTGPITNSYGFYAEDPNSTNFFAGKVGIGTVTPGQKLSVAGMVESTSGGFKFPDGSVQTTSSGGTITGVTAGTGLTGGGTSGNVGLSANFSSVQARVTGTCSSGSAVGSIGEDGSVSCNTGGGGGSLTLPFSGTGADNPTAIQGVFKVTDTTNGPANTQGGPPDPNTVPAAVLGLATGTGIVAGVVGKTTGSDGVGVVALNSATVGDDTPVMVAWSQATSGKVTLFNGIANSPQAKGIELQFAVPTSRNIIDVSVGSTTELFAVDGSGNIFGNGNLNIPNGVVNAKSKSFKIDDPIDPANKWLYHTSVESPDMMTIYNGVVVLDARGQALVEMPDYFEALNKDFRYQLTALGRRAPNLYIAREIKGNRFKISGGRPHGKVSWQVTGIRHDAWAQAHRTPVEQEKSSAERSQYLDPEGFGHSDQDSVTAAASNSLRANQIQAPAATNIATEAGSHR